MQTHLDQMGETPEAQTLVVPHVKEPYSHMFCGLIKQSHIVQGGDSQVGATHSNN